MYTIGFLGAGKMATALASSIIKGRLGEPGGVVCFDVSSESLQKVQNELHVQIASDAAEVFARCEIVFLAFKPQNFPDAIQDLKPCIRDGIYHRHLFSHTSSCA